MANMVPMTQGAQASDGNRKVILQGAPCTRYEDGTGGGPEATVGNITSPQTIDGLTPTRIVVPPGAIRFFVRTFAADGLRVGNNADLSAANPGSGYVVALQNEWIEVGCQAQASGAGPTGAVSSLSTLAPLAVDPGSTLPAPLGVAGAASTSNASNTTANPEIYVMLNDADAGEAEIYFYFHMLF